MQATLVRWFDVEAMDAKAPEPGAHRLIRWYDMDGQISEASEARVRAMVRRRERCARTGGDGPTASHAGALTSSRRGLYPSAVRVFSTAAHCARKAEDFVCRALRPDTEANASASASKLPPSTLPSACPQDKRDNLHETWPGSEER